MRKINSEFKAAFISEAGAALTNNDYFAFIELDDYACYVISDSITDREKSESARTAVESILTQFQENPSMGKRAIRSYLQGANRALLRGGGKEPLKASATVIVTDYETLRYGCAGNARFGLYREGMLKARSLDMSLSQDLAREDKLVPNALSRHAERHNLYTYLGQEREFHPYISDKLRLADGDIAALYTRGVWENLDEGEIDDVFAEAGDDPQALLDNAEDLLLSKQPDALENYTLAVVFVNKAFSDPNRQRRIRRRIKIALIVFLVLLIVGVVAWILYSRHRDKVDEMDLRTANAVACMQDNNFVRAQEEAKKALEQAENLKDKEKMAQLGNYLRLIEAVNKAEDAFQNQKYEDAYEDFRTALETSRYADNLGKKLIERRIKTCEDHLTAADLISLGDKLLENAELDKAEQRYLEARDLAAKVHDAAGKQQAKDALEKLYDARKTQKAEAEKKQKQKLSDDLTDLIGMGDALMQGGDLAGAEEKYLQAREAAARGYDADGKKEALAALDKLHEAKAKRAEEMQKEAALYAEAYTAAAALAAQGDAAFGTGDLSGAEVYYNTALEKYTALADAAQIGALSGKLQSVAVKRQERGAREAEAAKLESQTRSLYGEKEFDRARLICRRARDAYASLGMTDKAEELRMLSDQIDIDAAIMATLPE